MKINIGKIRFSVGFPFFASAAFFFAAGMHRNYICCMIFSSLHEIGHLIPLMIMGCDINDISLGAMGIRIGKSNCSLSYKNECVAALCGPAVNAIFIIVFFFLKNSSDMFILPFNINVGLFIINMLPVRMLDGGRFLNYLLLSFYDEDKVNAISNFVEMLVSIELIIVLICTLCLDIINTSFIFFVIFFICVVVVNILAKK
ncbi:MAG: hypothetical protein IJZ35_07805 [Clostridia bacterium]|nr:hypothetical protein [Clostridia bacterium]